MKSIGVETVMTENGLRYKVVQTDISTGERQILRDYASAGIFQTPEQANIVGDFWSERRGIPFERMPCE